MKKVCLFLKAFPLCVLLLNSSAQARVFKLGSQKAGSYIQGTFGNSLVGKKAYERDTVTFENSVDSTSSGEFGFMFLASRTWIRLGVEVVRPRALEGAQAKDASDNTLYHVTSGILAYGPVINFEFPLKVFESARFFFSGGGGYMKVTVKNDYALTTLGTSTYGVEDYSEEATTYAFMSQASIGMELALADSSTFVLVGGYRSLLASSLKHERAVTGVDGAINSGDTFRASDGQDRNLNLSGYWAGIGLRFYWNF